LARLLPPSPEAAHRPDRRFSPPTEAAPRQAPPVAPASANWRKAFQGPWRCA